MRISKIVLHMLHLLMSLMGGLLDIFDTLVNLYKISVKSTGVFQSQCVSIPMCMWLRYKLVFRERFIN